MSGPTVYLVDDDESFLRAVSRLLGRSGFQVATLHSAAELLAFLRPDCVGCVVADLNMPGMDGLALQQSLQRTGNPLPVVKNTRAPKPGVMNGPDSMARSS